MSKQPDVNVLINGKECKGKHGDTILNIARANGINIPTMCYLTKVSPIASCRMCIVEVENIDGFVLSCQERAVDGAVITTTGESLERERHNIMELYNVNHPLECGVCDKSGECDLQNLTLSHGVEEQKFTAKDQFRPVQNWGYVTYNPSLCIMCEKCASVSNEITGDASLQIEFGGYSSTILNVKPDMYNMALGEAASVCPVGALVNSDYKYSTNAWELQKIPAACPHCSGGCQIYYEVKNDKIYRVSNEFEYSTVCAEGRYNFNFENRNVKRDKTSFDRAVEAFKSADSIIFNSKITNEEALILQKLKDKLGCKLVNYEAYSYGKFLEHFSSVSGKSLYDGTLSAIADSDALIVLGTRVNDDSDQLKYHITKASKHNLARLVYMHPIEDASMQSLITQFIKYEVGSEEAVVAMLAQILLEDETITSSARKILDELDIGNLSAESNIGEEELDAMKKSLFRKDNICLIVGADLYAHNRANSIAKMLGLLAKYTDITMMITPPSTNTLGVSLICDLDTEVSGKSIGYNVKADFVLSSGGDGDLDMPALNQQEGTFTSMDKLVLPTNAAIGYDGYTLNDIANEIGLKSEYTISYTSHLPVDAGFRSVEFDSLDDYYDNMGNSHRGYKLSINENEVTDTIDDVDELDEYDGVVVYSCNSKEEVAKSLRPLNEEDKIRVLRGSRQFSVASKLQDGETIKFNIDGVEFTRLFKIDENLKGTIALNPVFDKELEIGMLKSYRFNKPKFEKVVN